MRVSSRRSALMLTLLAAILGLALAAQGLGAQTPAAGAGTDPAYAAGYGAGFPLGLKDQAAGAEANAHKFRTYQDGTAGYTETYGTPEAYRAAFQSGFADGYSDAYNGRRPALALNNPEAAPEATPPPVSAAPDIVTVARANGYREGYSVGQADANRSANYNAQASREYQQAMVGYGSTRGDASQYQLNFRSGFATGYSDGYYHRLYNTAVGARPAAGVDTAATGANPLPPDPASLAARPSGVYDNGVFLAQGTRIQATLDRAISTKTAQVGDGFSLTVSVPVWVGAVAAIPAGSTIQCTLEQVSRGGKLSGNAQLQLQFTTITIPGQAPVALAATTAGVGADASNVGGVNSAEGTITGQGAETAKHAGTGAAVGAVLGGIFGGGSGILRGGAAGAAAGTAGVLLSHKKDLVLDQGETISLRLDQPLELPTR
jgi:hypothetical protein